jgi:hypothetical protein
MPATEDQIVLIPHSLTLPPPRTRQRGVLPEHALENTGGSASSRCPPSSFRHFLQPAIDDEGIVKRVSSTGAYSNGARYGAAPPTSSH